MKKYKPSKKRGIYVPPKTDVVFVKMNSILCGSNEGVGETPGVW